MMGYGVDNPSKSQIVKDAKGVTIKHNYGGFGFGSDTIKNKIHETVKRKYGANRIHEIPQWKAKMKIINLERKFFSSSKEGDDFITCYLAAHNINPSFCLYGESELWISFGQSKRYFYDLAVFDCEKSKNEKDLSGLLILLEYDGAFWHPTIDQSITYRDEDFGITKTKTRQLYLKDRHKEIIAKRYCENFIRVRR